MVAVEVAVGGRGVRVAVEVGEGMGVRVGVALGVEVLVEVAKALSRSGPSCNSVTNASR